MRIQDHKTLSAGAALMLLGLFALAIIRFWPLFVTFAIFWGAKRLLWPGVRRPRSSWAKLIESLALLVGALSAHRFVTRNGRPLRVSVPAKAGRAHVDQYGEVPY